ncbi:MAG: holo-ACP synthase [candidate division Zixibacteria bacterium]|nr:holo-ACP synthase [candidate division Zixibacteria bacterium]MDD5425840.1 holo-ACP synthase [candidate division Zixibacteria bacterium]
MIIGIGSDIIEVARMKEELAYKDKTIREELFTENEIRYCEGKRYPERHYAARFAAKEAVFKALQTGRQPEFSWHDIEIQNDTGGRPHLSFSGNVHLLMDRLAVRHALVSLSHTSEQALAVVILEN